MQIWSKGLSSDEKAVDYIKQSTSFDGIISTKPAFIRHAKKHGIVSYSAVLSY
jgi:glycerol uptake operon antiterminator